MYVVDQESTGFVEAQFVVLLGQGGLSDLALIQILILILECLVFVHVGKAEVSALVELIGVIMPRR